MPAGGSASAGRPLLAAGDFQSPARLATSARTENACRRQRVRSTAAFCSRGFSISGPAQLAVEADRVVLGELLPLPAWQASAFGSGSPALLVLDVVTDFVDQHVSCDELPQGFVRPGADRGAVPPQDPHAELELGQKAALVVARVGAAQREFSRGSVGMQDDHRLGHRRHEAAVYAVCVTTVRGRRREADRPEALQVVLGNEGERLADVRDGAWIPQTWLLRERPLEDRNARTEVDSFRFGRAGAGGSVGVEMTRDGFAVGVRAGAARAERAEGVHESRKAARVPRIAGRRHAHAQARACIGSKPVLAGRVAVGRIASARARDRRGRARPLVRCIAPRRLAFGGLLAVAKVAREGPGRPPRAGAVGGPAAPEAAVAGASLQVAMNKIEILLAGRIQQYALVVGRIACG